MRMHTSNSLYVLGEPIHRVTRFRWKAFVVLRHTHFIRVLKCSIHTYLHILLGYTNEAFDIRR